MNAILQEYHGLLLSMLKVIDGICKKHNIPYMLFAGTALGAVRHGGFIPWDDDLDILMMRDDYERFLKLAPRELDETLFLQSEFSEHWPMFYSKLRKNNTAYIEKYYPKDTKQHQGAFIDIFPCDNLSDSRFKRKLQFYASKIVIAKSLGKRGYVTDSAAKKLFIALCSLLPLKPFHKLVCNRKENKSKYVHSFFGGSSAYDKSIYERCWITELTAAEFSNSSFPVSKHYNELLGTLYGDYMKLPPEEERKCKSHAMKIDIMHSYEDYIDWQKEQKIDIYTRSIR